MKLIQVVYSCNECSLVGRTRKGTLKWTVKLQDFGCQLDRFELPMIDGRPFVTRGYDVIVGVKGNGVYLLRSKDGTLTKLTQQFLDNKFRTPE